MTCTAPNVSKDGRYSITESAKALGIDRTTIYRYIRQKLIKFGVHKYNSRRFILGSELIRFWGAEYMR
jgi:predicted DNA-binding transcriptional regulator AlpA